MNWSKAKTILIIVFLIADSFLFYVTYQGDIAGIGAANKDNIEQVIEYLEKQNITINTDIPSKGIPSSLLKVKYKSFDEEVKEIFFNLDDNISKVATEEKTVFESKEALLELRNNGEIFYYNKSLKVQGIEAFNIEKTRKNIDEFLRILDIDESDLILVKETTKAGSIKVEYNQNYKNQFIDNTYLEIEATNDQISHAKILWFESVENGKTKNDVIPPIKALMKIAEAYRKAEDNVIIEDISQGFYFNNRMEKAFEIESVEEGTAIPVWRIKSNSGDVYINAYNGTIEEYY